MLRLTPDKVYYDNCGNKYGSDKLKFNMEWKSKNQYVFRGSATGCGITELTNMRIKAAILSKSHSDILDAKLTSWNKKPKMYDGHLNQIDPNDFDIQVGLTILWIYLNNHYKYLLNIDGHVKAFRLGNNFVWDRFIIS